MPAPKLAQMTIPTWVVRDDMIRELEYDYCFEEASLIYPLAANKLEYIRSSTHPDVEDIYQNTGFWYYSIEDLFY